MDKLIIASMRPNAGKTSLITGLAKTLDRKMGYMKPLGDRLLYRKKRLWDHDAALIAGILGLSASPEEMTIGFDHAKLRYMYDQNQTREKLLEAVAYFEQDREVLLVESSRDITCGISVYLDPIFVARQIGGKLLIVISGDEDTVLDDITFIKQRIDMSDVDFGGVVINQLHDVANFKNTALPGVTEMGINVCGIIPHQVELTYFSVDYLADRLFAKVVAGESDLKGTVHNIFVGAMSTNAAFRSPGLKKENNLFIIRGDRTDMIVAALEGKTVGIILTNNILPPPNIVSIASENKIPLLVVPADTYEVAKQIDNLQPLLTRDNTQKIDLLGELVQTHVDLTDLLDT